MIYVQPIFIAISKLVALKRKKLKEFSVFNL